VRLKKVLFDLDGTLWNTQEFHAIAESRLCALHGVTISAGEISSRYAGRPTEAVFKEILGCDDSLAAELFKEKWDYIFPTASEAEPLCDLHSLFNSLKERGVSIAIGTASPQEWALRLLRYNDLLDYFRPEDVVGGDMVENGKPAPDIWFKAAGTTLPVNCFVVEDGIAGIEAALKARMHCALLLPKRHPAAISISSAEEILELLF
jgi:beta-phosphoglucomutase-like phosphatase (HAD superfamily)